MEGLGINGPFLLAQIINFLVLFFLLRMILYRPVLNMLANRREKIRESLTAAETAQAAAANRSRENEEIIVAARRQAQDIVRQAEESARRRADEIIAQANQEAATRRERAVTDLEQERQQAAQALRDEVARISLAIARQTIGQSLVNEQAHGRIVQQFLSEGARTS